MSTKKISKFLPIAMIMGLVSVHAFADTSTGYEAAPSKKVVRDPINSVVSKGSYSAVPNYQVSDSDMTLFVFPDAIKGGILFKGEPIDGAIKYLAGNTQAVIQFKKSKAPVQMIIPMTNGDTLTLLVQPTKIPGGVVSVNGAKKQVAAPVVNSNSDAPVNGADVEIIKATVGFGEPPSGFDRIALPGVTNFDKFSVIPMAAWSNGSRRLYIFSLVSRDGQTAVVTPPQFYRPGITAVMIEGGDSVDANTSPYLFVVEQEDSND